jgi:hypothetical protein
MRLLGILLITLSINASAQFGTDSSAGEGNSPMRLSDYKSQKRVVAANHVALWTTHIVLTLEERQIMDAESREIAALIRRDTAALRKIWSRDFTLDDNKNSQVLTSNNPLPFYVSLHRVIEGLTKVEGMISIQGNETYQLLNPGGKPDDLVVRPFSPMWIQKNGKWTLTGSH